MVTPPLSGNQGHNIQLRGKTLATWSGENAIVVYCRILSLSMLIMASQVCAQEMVFLSFSMPKQSLELWFYQVQQLGLPIYFRGLYQNDFVKMKNKLLKYQFSSNDNIAIDPLKFKQYKIQGVPCLVKVSKSKFDKICGDVPLNYLLKIINSYENSRKVDKK